MDKGKGKLLSIVAIGVLCIALARLTGDQTAGMAFAPCAIYLAAYGAFAIACRRRVGRFVKIYYGNRFFINAKETSREALYKTVAFCAVCAVVLCVFARTLSTLITGSAKGRLALYAAAVAIVFLGAQSVLAGFNEGMGKTRATAIADIAHALLLVGTGLAAGAIGQGYGARLDRLLYTTDCAGAYAALFAFFGVLFTEIVLTLAMFLLRRRALKELEPLHETGKARFLGDKPAYFTAVWQWMCAMCLPFAAALATCALLRPKSPDAASTLGGHFFPIVIICGALASLKYIDACHRLSDTEKDVDAGEMGARFVKILRRLCAFSFPLGAFLMALAEPIERAIFLMPDDAAILTMSVGGFLTPFLSIALVLGLVLVLVRRQTPLFLSALFGFAGGVGLSVLLIVFASRGVYAVAISLLFTFFIFDVAALFAASRQLRVKSVGFARLALKPAGMAAASGLAIFLLATALIHLIGEIPTCIICVVVGGALYLVLMAAFKGFDKDDLSELPGGALLERVSTRGRK